MKLYAYPTGYTAATHIVQEDGTYAKPLCGATIKDSWREVSKRIPVILCRQCKRAAKKLK
jgi:hypothetical protein